MRDKVMIEDDNAKAIQAFPLKAGGIGSSSTTIDVSSAKMITFDAEVTIQLNGAGETFTVIAGSRWAIDDGVTSITVGAATKYILG